MDIFFSSHFSFEFLLSTVINRFSKNEKKKKPNGTKTQKILSGNAHIDENLYFIPGLENI